MTSSSALGTLEHSRATRGDWGPAAVHAVHPVSGAYVPQPGDGSESLDRPRREGSVRVDGPSPSGVTSVWGWVQKVRSWELLRSAPRHFGDADRVSGGPIRTAPAANGTLTTDGRSARVGSTAPVSYWIRPGGPRRRSVASRQRMGGNLHTPVRTNPVIEQVPGIQPTRARVVRPLLCGRHHAGHTCPPTRVPPPRTGKRAPLPDPRRASGSLSPAHPNVRAPTAAPRREGDARLPRMQHSGLRVRARPV